MDYANQKHSNGPNPSRPSRGLHEHLREAYAGLPASCHTFLYSCTGTEETSMIRCSFQHVLKVIGLIPSCNSQLHTYARHCYAFLRLPTQTSPTPASRTAYAASRAVPLCCINSLNRQKQNATDTQGSTQHSHACPRRAVSDPKLSCSGEKPRTQRTNQ